MRWLEPVRRGDRLMLRATLLEVRISKSRPERGVHRWRWRWRWRSQLFNQNREEVSDLTTTGLFSLALCR
jgi:acyl dehydratase